MVSNDEHENPELEMSGILEEFLTSPRSVDVRSSVDSFKDGSVVSLERSNNSSSSSCCSSCSCHPMSALRQSTRSALVFHHRPILPPLLCSSARTEMMIYKTRAIEKEKRQQEKKKQHLISRVEAILAGVQYTPEKPPPAPESANLRDKPTRVGRSWVQNAEDGSKPVNTPSDCDVTCKPSDQQQCGNNAIPCESSEEVPAEIQDNASSDSDSFHDKTYKTSLRNLLQKSLSFDAKVTASSSENDDVTVIEARHDDEALTAEDSFVKTIVETAIKDATDDIINEQASQDLKSYHEQTIAEDELPSESIWGTPEFNTRSDFLPAFTLHQSTSTKVNATLEGSSETSEAEDYLPPNALIELTGSVCFETTVTDDLTMLQPVASNTVSDCAIDDTKENRDPTVETVSLENESLFIDRGAEFSTTQVDNCNQEEQTSVEVVHRTHVRRGSYTLDEPSPYLVRNKESLTIELWENLEEDIVIRKLDLPSDSDEISLRTEPNDVPSRAELSVTNLCRILQDQHKNQMEEMKKRHDEQLEALQKELSQGEKMNLPQVGCTVEPRYSDVTISPSLASTEYKDIALTKKFSHPEFSGPRGHEEINSSVSRITDFTVTDPLHRKLCKFSALCRGHLTRQLLRSSKVQEIMQVIRDTSSLILCLRKDLSESKGLDSVRDSYLENRLYTQLRSTMFQFHGIFFETTIGERMAIIAQSCQQVVNKKLPRTRKLSTATQKSLERKRLQRSPQTQPTKVPPKQIKSKISHIWKSQASGTSMNLAAKSMILKFSPPLKERAITSRRRFVSSQGKTTSYGMQSLKSDSMTKKFNNHVNAPVMSQRKATMPSSNIPSSKTSIQRKTGANRKSAPLSNRENNTAT